MTRPGIALGLACALAIALAIVLAPGPSGADGEPTKEGSPSDVEDRDLGELVRRGGKFPEGYVPRDGSSSVLAGDRHYLRALGRLILRTLDAKPGSAEAEVLSAALRDVAAALAVSEEEPLRIPELALGLARTALRGTEDPDPARAAAHRDVLSLVLLATAADAAPSSAAARILVGGASFEPGVASDGAPAALAVVVPAGSVAGLAGLRPGDRIRAVAGRPVDPRALAGASVRLEAGESVSLTVEDARGVTREVLLAPGPR